MKDFGVFILTHNRCGNVKTIASLEKGGYTGPWHLVIDDQDPALADYINTYGDKVEIFSKATVANETDLMNTQQSDKVVVFARNATFSISQKLGYQNVLVLDDDYVSWDLRVEVDGALKRYALTNLDRVFAAAVKYQNDANIDVLAIGQGGDYVGGAAGGFYKKDLARKAMNTFFFKTDTDIRFAGYLNEDVNMYVTENPRGRLILTNTNASVNQMQTQKQAGGLTETYLDQGTYTKSFYSVIANPSCVKISMMSGGHNRIHHKVDWERCAPKILHPQWRKATPNT